MLDWFKGGRWLRIVAAERRICGRSVPQYANPLKGKVICGSCGGKMQRRKGSGNADWYFFTCITNNRLGAGNCTGMYIREAEIIEAIRAEAVKNIARHQKALADYEQEKAVIDGNVETICKQIEEQYLLHQADYEDMVRGKIAKAIFLVRGAKTKALKADLLSAQDALSDLEIERSDHQMFCDVRTGAVAINELISCNLSRIVICQDKSISVEFL